MLHLRVYGDSNVVAEIGAGLDAHGTARHLAIGPGVRPGYVLLTAEVTGASADVVLEFVQSRGVAPEDITLVRLDDVGLTAPRHAEATLIWADMLGQARRYARPVARYLVFMLVAGVIAAYGVIEVNAILIVGAMAVSPDILPVTAACVGLVSGRHRLAWRAIVTLVVGLAATCTAAVALTAASDVLGFLPSDFVLNDSALSGLTTVNDATVIVAFAAGIAGMLALETRASSAVGVAISITTIPAAAYFGVAVAVGEMDEAWGALAVLGVNVVTLLAAGTATLILQRRLARRRGRPAPA
jgi:uncharacterized hydrophobic protein (TIGR00271 family)